jgi:hypothetical protein
MFNGTVNNLFDGPSTFAVLKWLSLILAFSIIQKIDAILED